MDLSSRNFLEYHKEINDGGSPRERGYSVQFGGKVAPYRSNPVTSQGPGGQEMELSGKDSRSI
jgi:hypothetical protein